jgi:L-lactate utilization protein LutB
MRYIGDRLIYEQPFRFVEPAIEMKREQIIKSKMRKGEEFNLDDIKTRLKEIRKNAVENADELIDRAVDNLNSYINVKVSYAKDADEAVNFILEAAEGTEIMAVNNSSTIAELVPKLLTHEDLRILDTYLQDLKLEEEDFLKEEASGYWDLPDAEPSSVWHSFVKDDHATGFLSTKITDKRFIGLLGVNVLSGEGRIFFVQHLRNISKILSHAKKVIIVAGIEKLVESDDDALFQARCCALFGYESILAEMFCLGQEGEKVDNKEADKEKVWYSQIDPHEVQVIIFDNGRKEVLAGEFKELLHCIGCRACTLRCPRAKCAEEGYGNAKDLLLSAFTRNIEHAASNGLFNCTLCKGCESACPADIPLTTYLSTMREQAVSKGVMPATYSKLSENVKQFGTPYGVKGLGR